MSLAEVPDYIHLELATLAILGELDVVAWKEGFCRFPRGVLITVSLPLREELLLAVVAHSMPVNVVHDPMVRGGQVVTRHLRVLLEVHRPTLSIY